MKTLQTKTTDNQPSQHLGSLAQESTSTENCAKHGPYESKSMKLGQKSFSTKCPGCSADEKAEEERFLKEQRAQDKIKRIEGLLARSAIPPRFLNRTFDNFRAETKGQQSALQTCKGMADSFNECMKHGTSLLMCGKPGTGKSHLSAAFAISVINTGRSAVYTTVLRAIRSIKDTYRKDSKYTEQEAINLFIAPDLLILDEVGVQFGTETEKMYLFEILNGRYEMQKPTVVITNLNREEASAYLGERIIDRLSEGGGGVIPFDWESYRSRVVSDPNLPSVEAKNKNPNNLVVGADKTVFARI
jgi:DNA replication protein DnaC